MRGVLPILRLSVCLDGSLIGVLMVLGVRSVALVPLRVQLLGGLGELQGAVASRQERGPGDSSCETKGRKRCLGNCRKLLTERKELSRASVPRVGGGGGK